MARIVIVGVGLLSSGGDATEALSALLHKKNTTETLLVSSNSSQALVHACTLDEGVFVRESESLPAWVAKYDRSVAAACIATKRAFAHAAIDLDGLQCAVIVGTSRSVDHTKTRLAQTFEKESLPKDALIQSLFSLPAWAVCKYLGTSGVAYTVSNACTGSLVALECAANHIKLGDAEVAVAVGVETSLTNLCLAQFSELGVCSPRGICMPFDVSRDGTIPGEGAAAIILASEEVALKQGWPIYAQLAGYASINDGFVYANDRTGAGVERVVRKVLAKAGIEAKDVAAVNAHATGTIAGDEGEGQALARLFPHRPPVYSVKPLVGHCNGAASLVEMAIGITAMRSSFIPGNYIEVADGACGNIALRSAESHTEYSSFVKISSGIGGAQAAAVITAA